MAKKVLLDVVPTINGTNLQQWCSKAEVNDTFEEKDLTTFGSGGAKEFLGGLEEGDIGFTFKNDFAVGQLDEIMWGLRRQVVPFSITPANGAISTSNPAYSGNLLVSQWKPIAGSVGDVAEVDVTFKLSGPLVRDTTP